jgi:non-heme chloroperoxidase
MFDQHPLKNIHINATPLYYIEHGTGEPLIFIHGSLGDYRSWKEQFDFFAGYFHGIAYSRRYHYPGETGNPNATSPANEQIDDLARLITQLKLAPAVLVASSFGAYLSLLLASRRPELVRGMVLGGPPIFNLLPPEEERQIVSDIFTPARQAVEAGNIPEGMRIFLDGMIDRGFFERMQPAARQRILDNSHSFILEQNTPLEQHFIPIPRGELQQIRTPILLISAERSQPFLDKITHALVESLPNVEHAVIPNTSNGSMHNQNPLAYNQVVLEFLCTRIKGD